MPQVQLGLTVCSLKRETVPMTLTLYKTASVTDDSGTTSYTYDSKTDKKIGILKTDEEEDKTYSIGYNYSSDSKYLKSTNHNGTSYNIEYDQYGNKVDYGKYHVHVICDAFDIPRGTFYNHVLRNKKDNTWYAKRREKLRLRIQEIYDESNQIFGAAKIAAVMKSEGFKVSNEMVRTLMRDMGLVSIRQSAKKLYEDEGRKYKNYLNQEFDVNKPNEVWVSDVTYFKYGKNAYYICVIIDLFSRMVVGYKIGKTNSTQLVKSTFQIAYKVRQPDSSLIFHTDRGGNYSSKTMNDYMRSLHITHSFSRAHVPYDNSVMESFFSSMKREELYRTKYRSESDFRNAVDRYIIFYNTKRPHKKLQYKTPEQKEEEYALKDVDL